jgi:hypothetical protein
VGCAEADSSAIGDGATGVGRVGVDSCGCNRPRPALPLRDERRCQLQGCAETRCVHGLPRAGSRGRGCGGQVLDKPAMEESWRHPDPAQSY